MKGASQPSFRNEGTREPCCIECYGPCLGSRQIHQGKRYKVFFTLFLMAGHFLRLSSVVGKGIRRKMEPFFIFLPLAFLCDHKKPYCS